MSNNDTPEAAEIPTSIDPATLREDGLPLWSARTLTGRKIGMVPRIAAWLTFFKQEGDTFTMAELRTALAAPGEASAGDEHLNRRLRELRSFRDRSAAWILDSQKDDGSLAIDEYRLVTKGWHPGLGPQPKRGSISQKLRRSVLDRDGHACVICGVMARGQYPNEPDSSAVLTIGHRIPQASGGTDEYNNLQTECKRCNEPARNATGAVESLHDVYPFISQLPRRDKKTLLDWIESGTREPTPLEDLFIRSIRLGSDERKDLIVRLRKSVGNT